MKKNKQKLKIYFMLGSFAFMNTICKIQAEGEEPPKFNNEEAQEFAGGILTPIITFAMWAIPPLVSIALLISGLTWLSKDEDEKEQKPFLKIAKKILIVGVGLESIPVLMRIFGIA